jgi:hypothetical protein
VNGQIDGDLHLDPDDNLTPGWYVVRIDSNGFDWAMMYGGWCDEHRALCADTANEEAALADYESANLTYLTWAEEESYED